MGNSITINTVQGIGDIFWVYQKLAPHFDTINMNVLCVDTGPVQLRAQAFCRMLPKVGTVNYVKVPGEAYHKVAQTTYRLPIANGRVVDYAVNAPLEIGINLRDIDPGAAIEEFVDMGLPATVERGDYLCAFVAGAKGPTLWPPEQWGLAIRKLMVPLDVKRVVLIGAEWDRAVQNEVYAYLRRKGIECTNKVGLGLADSIDVIRRARFLFGFQSGLNVIAENYDVEQLMVYFAKLRAMQYTWCKPASVRTRFHAMTFDDNVDEAIAALPVC